jgi:hypothetical protein
LGSIVPDEYWGLCHISKYAEALTRREFLLPELLFFPFYGIIRKMPEIQGPPAAKEKGRDAP